MKGVIRVLFILSFLIGLSEFGYAEVKDIDLSKKIVVTEGQLLMNQVDIVSLYLSSTKEVAYEPEEIWGGKIRIDVVVLNGGLLADDVKLEEYVSRQIVIFKSELAKRLELNSPSVAKNFNSDRDLFFVINKGIDRVKVAEVADGQWRWMEGGKGVVVKGVDNPVAGEKIVLSDGSSAGPDARWDCNCPAAVGKK